MKQICFKNLRYNLKKKLRYFFIRVDKIFYSIYFCKSYNLLLKGIFPSCEHKELFQLIGKRCDSIIDVGLNRGQFSLLASNYLMNIPIFGFEPLNELYEPFEKYFFKRFKKRILKIYPFAISDLNYIKKFYVTKKSDCSSLLEPSEVGLRIEPNLLRIKKIINVEVKKLDDILLLDNDFVNCNSSFLKIDTQGTELLVLKGSKKLLKHHIKYIYLEASDIEHYKNQNKTKELIDLLAVYNFILRSKFNVSSTKSGKLSYADLLFEKKI